MSQYYFNSESYGLKWGMIPYEPTRKPAHEPEVRDAIAAYKKRFEPGLFQHGK